MGTRGHCRVRPVHIAGLLKRYRQLLGEMCYCQTHLGHDHARISALQNACALLSKTLKACDAESDLTTIRPIRYRPPDPLSAMALTRAILAELRCAANTLTAEAVACSIVDKQSSLPWSQESAARLVLRVRRALSSLVERDVILQHSNDQWSIRAM